MTFLVQACLWNSTVLCGAYWTSSYIITWSFILLLRAQNIKSRWCWRGEEKTAAALPFKRRVRGRRDKKTHTTFISRFASFNSSPSLWVYTFQTGSLILTTKSKFSARIHPRWTEVIFFVINWMITVVGHKLYQARQICFYKFFIL